MPTLSPDILHEIMVYLRRPLPPAHTKLSDRSLIRQPDLFASLLVCKDWYNAAAPVLYKYAATDDFPLFLFRPRGAGTPRCPDIKGIIPKIDLFGFTQRLFIEYSDKDGEENNPNDETLRWISESWEATLGGKAVNFHYQAEIAWAVQLAREAQQLSSALSGLTGWLNVEGPTVFTRLSTIAVGAFFGEEEEVHHHPKRGPIDEWEEYGRMFRQTQRAFRQLVAGIPTLQSYCQTPSLGPLALGEAAYLPLRNDSRPLIAYHVYLRVAFPPQFSIGVPFRWYNHDVQMGWMYKSWFHKLMSKVMNALSSHRDMLAKRCRPSTDLNIDGMIYFAVPPDGSVDLGRIGYFVPQPKAEEDKSAWRVESEDLERAVSIRSKARKGYSPAHTDVYAFRQLFDALPCEACGWRYEVERSIGYQAN